MAEPAAGPARAATTLATRAATPLATWPEEWLRPRRGVSLTTRILAVNVIALGLMAASLFYLDSYRRQLLSDRFVLARAEAEIAADALRGASPAQRRDLLMRIGTRQKLRLRIYGPDGALAMDSFRLATPSFVLADPRRQRWYQRAARVLDRGMDAVLGAPPVPLYVEPRSAARDSGSRAWPEIARTRADGRPHVSQRYAPDRTPVITAAVPIGDGRQTLLTTRNAPDITQAVRDARQTLAIVVGVALAISVLLSLFLARTIVQPLRTLVRAAVRVRSGRDREVVVPRLPDRRDEIGLLARAVSDMSQALRQRIDAVESFAADVSHELKNPLASLRSALEALERVDDATLRRQLTGIAAHDVRRIDRLITEIADASRIDAQLSRTTFQPVDMERLASAIVAEREQRGANGDHAVDVRRGGADTVVVVGDPLRLERVLHNLIDNAVSFSPPAAPIALDLGRQRGEVHIAVSDLGPGISPAEREKVFERFHSLRPAGEDFASHSGLGLAIARTIVEAHGGHLTAMDRADGREGACLVAVIPAQEDGS